MIDYIKFIGNIDMQKALKEVKQAKARCVPKVLYKYYSLSDDHDLNEKKLDFLETNKIYLSQAQELNDFFDQNAMYINMEKIPLIQRMGTSLFNLKNLTEGATDRERIACFTSNGISSLPMWAHYSNNHKGYCVEYSISYKDNLILWDGIYPVQYVDKKVDVTAIFKDKIKSSINFENMQIGDFLLRRELFSNIKHSSWSYENEYRYKVCNGTKEIQAIPTKIYAGVNCSDVHFKRLKDIGNTNGVEILKMAHDHNSKDFNLKAYNEVEHIFYSTTNQSIKSAVSKMKLRSKRIK